MFMMKHLTLDKNSVTPCIFLYVSNTLSAEFFSLLFCNEMLVVPNFQRRSPPSSNSTGFFRIIENSHEVFASYVGCIFGLSSGVLAL